MVKTRAFKKEGKSGLSIRRLGSNSDSAWYNGLRQVTEVRLSSSAPVGRLTKSNSYEYCHFHNIQKFAQTDRRQGAKHLNAPD